MTQTFAAPLEVRASDWPGPGPIDLNRHDLPHRSSTLEWWYVNGHVEDARGRPFSFFASFFQLRVGEVEGAGEPIYAHALSWALIDASGKRYISESLVDRDAPEIALERLKRGLGPRDARLRRALRETLEKGELPYPDVRMHLRATVLWDRLNLDYDGRTFEKLSEGRYHLRLSHSELEAGVDIIVELEKPVVRHGDDGRVAGTSAEEMFYYFCPRCSVSGTITLDGETTPIAAGSAWYDHEFGAGNSEDDDLRSVAWNWLSTQLDNGWEITVYDLFEEGEPRGHFAIVIDPQGKRHEFREFQLTGRSPWTSTRTFDSYPLHWTLRIPAAGIHLEADADFEQQEFITFISKSAFWEGRVRVRGVMGAQAVHGPGFVERANFGAFEKLDDFYAAVSRETRAAIERLLPQEPTTADVQRLVWNEHEPEWSSGVSPEAYRDAMIRPIRAIADRGGKAWRSYAALVCCDAVGGDSDRWREWLALPELLHVGSLMVDDVQDRSQIRRGGPPAHHLYGEGPTINAGNFCYFLPHLFLNSRELDDRQRLFLYDQYLLALRAAHAGQALDLAGATDAVDAALESGNSVPLLERVVAVHRLKSAAPASSLAQTGAVLGGGSDAQIRGLGDYFQQIGIAFQIMDDVLNLRGFEGDLKIKGEDIAEGKATMPVAKAIALLPLDKARALWSAILARPTDPAEVARIISIIRDCGGLDACEELASELVESAWQRLDPLIRDSCYKLNLRAFGWYVLERHY